VAAKSRERKELQMFENNLFRKVDLSRTEMRRKILAVLDLLGYLSTRCDALHKNFG
jgi:hypothetical protein